MNNIAIKIEEVNKKFDNLDLFKDFSLSIFEGDIHALIGENGSGKTTLLRLITSLYKPDKGNIIIDGKYSMLLENDYLYEDMTGIKNIELFSKYFGFANDTLNYKEYSDLFDITDKLNNRVSTYSKGMKRKLSILIIILIDTEIILLDEPTSGVDPISRVQIRRILSKLKEMGKTILITSHDLGEIEKIADKVTMIKRGKIVFTSSIEDFKGESLENIFIERGIDSNE